MTETTYIELTVEYRGTFYTQRAEVNQASFTTMWSDDELHLLPRDPEDARKSELREIDYQMAKAAVKMGRELAKASVDDEEPRKDRHVE